MIDSVKLSTRLIYPIVIRGECVKHTNRRISKSALQQAQQRIHDDLLTALDAFSIPEPLKSAVQSCGHVRWKTVRPALCYADGHILNPNNNAAAVRRAAVAVELIHCYSLAHDDLPCMDNESFAPWSADLSCGLW